MSASMNEHTPASAAWTLIDQDGTITVGVTELAQATLGRIVGIEFSAPGTCVKAGQAVAVLQSDGKSSAVCSPIDGEIASVNHWLAVAPDQVNEFPHANWIVRIKPRAPRAGSANATSIFLAA
jgi:glycine cleavage system H protein